MPWELHFKIEILGKGWGALPSLAGYKGTRIATEEVKIFTLELSQIFLELQTSI